MKTRIVILIAVVMAVAAFAVGQRKWTMGLHVTSVRQHCQDCSDVGPGCSQIVISVKAVSSNGIAYELECDQMYVDTGAQVELRLPCPVVHAGRNYAAALYPSGTAINIAAPFPPEKSAGRYTAVYTIVSEVSRKGGK